MAADENPSQQSPPTRPPQWTVMIYMAAGDGADLDAHAVADLREMERAAVGREVNIVAQIDRFWPARPQRFEIRAGNTRLVRADVIADEPLDDEVAAAKDLDAAGPAVMGHGATLGNFLRWARTRYPAKHYFLVLWGHAYGLGFGRDHGDPLTLPEIREAITAFRRTTTESTTPGHGRTPPPDTSESLGPKLDLLGANACAVSYVEAACELADDVEYLVASEIAMPFAGWPYEAILRRLAKGHDGRALTAAELATLVADRYVSHYSDARGGQRVAMAVLHLAQAADMKALVHRLAGAIDALLDCDDPGAVSRRAHLRAVFLSTAGGDVRPMLDVYDLARRLLVLCEDLTSLEPATSTAVQGAIADLATAAKAVTSFIRPAPAARADEAGTPPPRRSPFVVSRYEHPELADLHGVGIFAPFVTDERDLKRLGLDAGTPGTGRDAYFDLAFSDANAWPALVYDTLRSALPDDLVSGVEGSGAASRSERLGVTQLLTCADAVFDVLDRRIAVARKGVGESLPAAAGVAGGQAMAIEASALNLLGKLRLVRHDEIDAMFEAHAEMAKTAGGAGRQRSSWNAAHIGTSSQAEAIGTQFMRLESAIQETGQTVRRTLTNGTFGLGPGLGRDKEGFLGDKEGFLGRDKEGFLGRDKEGFLGRDKEGFLGRDKEGFLGRDKEGFLGRDKEGFLGDKEGFLGLVAAAVAANAAVQPTPAEIVAGLFGEVGAGLRAVEAACAEAETIAAKAVLAPADLGGFGSLANVTLAKARVERAFDRLSEASAALRQIVRGVASHPAYGIGPGPQGLTVDDRRELARVGGVNAGMLALL